MRAAGLAYARRNLTRETLFELSSVDVTRDGHPILIAVDLVIESVGVTALVGPSGAGKSTLLRLLNRLESPTGGEIAYRGRPLAGLDPLSHRREVGMVFQRPALFGGTTLDNLRVADPLLRVESAEALLQRVGLSSELLERDAAKLSGGEAQRLSIARALAAQPRVLLMDEPTASVDPALRYGLEDLALELASQGIAVIWVSHDLEQVRRIADRVVLIVGGRVKFSGSVDDLGESDDPAVGAFFDEPEGPTHDR